MATLNHYHHHYYIKLINANNEVIQEESFIDLFHKKALTYFNELVEICEDEQEILIQQTNKTLNHMIPLLHLLRQCNKFIPNVIDYDIPKEYRNTVNREIAMFQQ